MSAVPAAAPQRHSEPVDVHLILRRGGEVLLSRRAGTPYAAGLLHMPSGHLDGPFEDVLTALIREAREEVGVVIDPADARPVVVMHHRNPVGQTRTGWFFEVTAWAGTPEIREPNRCSELGWFPLHHLPADMVAYCRAGLDAYLAGHHFALHVQHPEDPIAYDPQGPNRLRLLPQAGMPDRVRLASPLAGFAQQAVGPLRQVDDASWPRPSSRVWRLTGRHGGTWYLKQHHNLRFHQREVTAYQRWTHALHGRAPTLLAVDEEQLAIVLTELPGRPLHGVSLPPEQERDVHRQLGTLARRFHDSAPALPARPGPAAAVKAERHLNAARPHLADQDEAFARSCAEQLSATPVIQVPTMGDLQLRNALLLPDGHVAVFDFEQAEYGPRVRDFVRLADAWSDRPDLREAFFSGYGRKPTCEETRRLKCEATLDAVSGVAWGTANHDPEVVQRGLRTLHRLRTGSFP